jgi:hypothetical protein
MKPIPGAARSKAWNCGSLFSGSAGSNPSGDMGVCLLWVLCVVRYRSLRRGDHSSRGALPTVVCLNVIVKPRQRGGRGPLAAVAPWKTKSICCSCILVQGSISHAGFIYIFWNSNLVKHEPVFGVKFNRQWEGTTRDTHNIKQPHYLNKSYVRRKEDLKSQAPTAA